MRQRKHPEQGQHHRQSWVRTQPLLNVFNHEVWIFLWSNNIYFGVSTKVLNEFNHTHEGGINRIHAQDKWRIRLGFNLRKANFYAWVYLKEKIFWIIILYRVTRRINPPRIQVYELLPNSSSAVAHGTAAGHFSKTTQANPSIPRRSTSCVTKP